MTLLEGIFKKPNRKQEAIDEYNLGLAAKYSGRWEESLARNRRAAELNSADEASWWNMGIAATALREWPDARRAWSAVGITLPDGVGEVVWEECWACVRLRPDGCGEVVWGKRVDPARIRVMNVPLPQSERRYGDIVLNDGAQEGTRTSRGQDFPVFNELALWQHSPYSTYSLEVGKVNDDAKASLDRLCNDLDLSFEDWGTVRHLCAACSRGNPGPHECTQSDDGGGLSTFGVAARGQSSLDDLLGKWMEIEPSVELGKITLAVAGANA